MNTINGIGVSSFNFFPTQYAIVATNIAGETTAKFRLGLLKTPPQFVKSLERFAEVDQGEKLELKALVEGSPNPKATWFKDGQEIEPSDAVKLTNTPDGVVKLEIEHAKPSDCGAYKLVIANPHGESAALCAVAVKRKFALSGSQCDLMISFFQICSGTNETGVHQAFARFEGETRRTNQFRSSSYRIPIAGDQMVQRRNTIASIASIQLCQSSGRSDWIEVSRLTTEIIEHQKLKYSLFFSLPPKH